MSVVTLLDNPWLSLKKVVLPERGISGYVFLHESRCHGCIIAVLPFRRRNGVVEYLVKSEVTPCWSLEPIRSALTGGWEGGRTVEDAQRELEEEAGYAVGLDQFILLGSSFASKSADTTYTLYAVDLTGLTPGEAKGDGSVLEASAESHWLSADELLNVMDPQVHVMFNRLQARHLKDTVSLEKHAGSFHVGQHVGWNSEAGHVTGHIVNVHTHDFEVNGYTHHCTPDSPQYEIKSSKTDHVAYHKAAALHRIG